MTSSIESDSAKFSEAFLAEVARLEADMKNYTPEEAIDVLITRAAERKAWMGVQADRLARVRALVLDLNADADYLVPKRYLGDRLRGVLADACVTPPGSGNADE